METVQKIQKVTSKGQITLPISWRRATGANMITLTVKGNRIEIAPTQLHEGNQYTVFDAIRDNKGKGIKVADLVKILGKIGA
ncbi:MAG: AbrB/MazE/SpoVT family DNA-binding domain-containing protein [bacterium]|nr:AbrB/MazE/SpoVT family DNA-binding domain-containing protein [bacterium]